MPWNLSTSTGLYTDVVGVWRGSNLTGMNKEYHWNLRRPGISQGEKTNTSVIFITMFSVVTLETGTTPTPNTLPPPKLAINSGFPARKVGLAPPHRQCPPRAQNPHSSPVVLMPVLSTCVASFPNSGLLTTRKVGAGWAAGRQGRQVSCWLRRSRRLG